MKKTEESDLTKFNLKGKVETVGEFDTISNHRFKVTYIFNQVGNIIAHQTFDKQGSQEFLYENIYDDNGVFIKETCKGKKGVLSSAIMGYDENGNIISEKGIKPDGTTTFVNTFEYKEFGHVIEETRSTKPNGKIDFKIVSKLDDKYNIVENQVYNSKGLLDNKSTYNHDEKGRVIERREYYTGDILERLSTYQYDTDGNMVERKTIDADDTLLEKVTYMYSDIDENGNWLEKQEFIDDELFETTRRTILYFED